jgi:hypothetical protein
MFLYFVYDLALFLAHHHSDTFTSAVIKERNQSIIYLSVFASTRLESLVCSFLP